MSANAQIAKHTHNNVQKISTLTPINVADDNRVPFVHFSDKSSLSVDCAYQINAHAFIHIYIWVCVCVTSEWLFRKINTIEYRSGMHILYVCYAWRLRTQLLHISDVIYIYIHIHCYGHVRYIYVYIILIYIWHVIEFSLLAGVTWNDRHMSDQMYEYLRIHWNISKKMLWIIWTNYSEYWRIGIETLCV